MGSVALEGCAVAYSVNSRAYARGACTGVIAYHSIQHQHCVHCVDYAATPIVREKVPNIAFVKDSVAHRL